jgi:hypothetical protein
VRNRKTSGICALCGRRAELTFHHLIPKKVHRRAFFRKNFSRAQLAAGEDLCRLCHRGVHKLYDEMTLATRFGSMEALRGDPAIARHAAWARKQKRGLIASEGEGPGSDEVGWPAGSV